MELVKKPGEPGKPGTVCPWLDREWLETDGRGGYCSMAVPLCSTRKYHGLLVTGIEGYEGRFVLLSGYEVLVKDIKGNSYRLDTNQYPGTFYPGGFAYLEKFDNKTFPSWTFSAGKIRVKIKIFMREDSAVYIVIKNKSAKRENRFEVSLSPVMAYRDSHTLTHENSALAFRLKQEGTLFRMGFYESMPDIDFLFSSDTVFEQSGVWLRNREYLREMERGFEFREDCYVPGSFSFALDPGEHMIARAALETRYTGKEYLEDVYAEERIKRESVKRMYRKEPEAVRILKQESRRFLVRNRENNLSVIAGYPWFGEWGRDTMISLPGLTGCLGNPAAGLEILKTYAAHIRDGLLPNTLGGAQGFESYNSIDAGLLFVWAAQNLFLSSRVGKTAVKEAFSAVRVITEAYLEEKVPGLKISGQGFPEAGSSETQLTWMDAKSCGKPVTPRGGSPVEITALFYNALRFCLQLEESGVLKKGRNRKLFEEASEAVEKNFVSSYWVEDGGYLADVVSGGVKDSSLRPNMLFALAIPYQLVDRERAKSIVEVTEKKLLTPAGLRTLSPDDSRFCPVYRGTGDERDSCYHQGTVWPWLFGIYTDAALYAADDKKKKAAEIEKMLLSFLEKHINEGGIGFVSEIFDALSPSEGKGTYAQAWSSAEIIRAWEKVRLIKSGGGL